jgi:hypothetical protein
MTVSSSLGQGSPINKPLSIKRNAKSERCHVPLVAERKLKLRIENLINLLAKFSEKSAKNAVLSTLLTVMTAMSVKKTSKMRSKSKQNK